ncbi:MAG: phage tail tape measure protein, partial [Wohlfahrtiimonas sp.]
MSQNSVDISIKTAVDGQKELTEYQKELIKLGRSSQEVDEQVDILGAALSDLAKATELKERLSETSEELEVTTDNLEKARDAFKRASEEALQFSKSADAKSVKDMNKVLADQEKEIKKLEQAQAKAQKKYSDTNKTIDQSSDSIRELIANTDQYNESIQKVESAQAKLNSELKNLQEIGDAYSKLGVHDLEKEIEDLENAYKVLKESGKLSADELRQAHEKLTEEVNKHKKALNGTDQAYKDLKTGAIHFLPVAAAFTAITKSAISYEDKMADVKKVITATDEEFKELSKSLVEMSKTTPVSATGLAEIAAAGAQLGVEVGNLKEFVTITADMATAFDMTAEDAGKAVASLSNIFGITINATKELGDAINHLSNNSASNARQIVDVLVRIGGTGKAIGLTQQEVAALGSTLISFGKSPEIASTALDAFLARLQMLNTLGPTGQDSLKKIGVSAVEMSQMIQNDAAGAITYFLDQVNKLSDT